MLPLPLVALFAVNWSAHVSVRALSGFSPEYFGATVVGNTAWVSFPPHSSRRKSLHLRPFNFPETFAATYRIEHAGTAKAALAAAFAFDAVPAAGAASGADFACAPLESTADPGG